MILFGFIGTSYRTPSDTTLYQLVFGKSLHLSVESEHKAYWAIQTLNFDLKAVDEKRILQLNELDELRLEACEAPKYIRRGPSNSMIRIL